MNTTGSWERTWFPMWDLNFCHSVLGFWTQRCLDYSPVSHRLLGSPFPFHPWTSNLYSIFLAPALLTPCYQACQLEFTASLGGVHIWILFLQGNHPAFHPSHWQVLRDINHLFLSSEESQSSVNTQQTRQRGDLSFQTEFVVFLIWLIGDWLVYGFNDWRLFDLDVYAAVNSAFGCTRNSQDSKLNHLWWTAPKRNLKY